MDVKNQPSMIKQLDQLGYAVFPALDSNAVAELVSAYATYQPENQTGFHCTMFSPNSAYRRAVDSAIKSVLDPVITRHLPGFRMLYANFMVKEPGPEGDFFVHQDWTYVNEGRSQSLALWLPLLDVEIDNGALHVVPGSHAMTNLHRGPGVYDPLSGLHQYIRNHLGRPQKMSAGEALVWDHRLVHYSLPNNSLSTRLAATVILVPEGEQVLHCRGTADGTMHVFHVDTDFFMSCSVHEMPKQEPAHKFSYYYPSLEERDFSSLCSRSRLTSSTIVNRISAFFNTSAKTGTDEA